MGAEQIMLQQFLDRHTPVLDKPIQTLGAMVAVLRYLVSGRLTQPSGNQSMDSERYNAREAEPKWQRICEEKEIFRTRNDDPRPKYYVLEMLPYPSGRIHMGQRRDCPRGFTPALSGQVQHQLDWRSRCVHETLSFTTRSPDMPCTQDA
jgi:hypothetical protein